MSHALLNQFKDKVLTVAEYLDMVNELLSPLRVDVEGEISDLKILPQWVFFDLKDKDTGAILRCGLHAGVYRRLGVNLEEGMSVKVSGYGKIAPKRGNFGFWVSKIEPIGEGALKRAYELLVKKLQKEGLFTRKRELPQFISHVGVVSSRNGVVLQDLQQNLKPLGIRIDFIHAGVEGADSAGEILRAIEQFSRAKEKPEVLVLIRGGGSLESLQGFNNESVCRALFAAPMPALVGIGHDVDAPIATMVADWSASTPTAVAHTINQSWAPLIEDVPLYTRRIMESFARRLQAVEHRTQFAFQTMRHAVAQVFTRFKYYEDVVLRAARLIPARITHLHRESGELVTRSVARLQARMASLERTVVDYERLLAVSDPERVLARGYGLVYTAEGTLVRKVEQVEVGAILKTRLSDGIVESQVTKKEY